MDTSSDGAPSRYLRITVIIRVQFRARERVLARFRARVWLSSVRVGVRVRSGEVLCSSFELGLATIRG